MAYDDGAAEAQLGERFGKQCCLGFSGPGTIARALAVPKSRPIKDDGSVCGSGMVDDAADKQIFHHGPVAMKEDNRRAIAALYVVKSHTIRRDEPAFGQISTFGLRCPSVHENS